MTRRAPGIVQGDFFDAGVTVGVEVAQADVPVEKPRRRRRPAHSQTAGLEKVEETGPTLQTRCHWDIAGNSKSGRTRQEIANRTGIKLQTVCGRVDRLLKAGLVFEPIVGYGKTGRPIYYVREGGKVLVDARFREFDWLRFGLLLPSEDE